MIGLTLRRILQLLPVLLIASLCIWAMIYAVPGGPVGVIVGENATQEQIDAADERIRARSSGAGAVRLVA